MTLLFIGYIACLLSATYLGYQLLRFYRHSDETFKEYVNKYWAERNSRHGKYHVIRKEYKQYVFGYIFCLALTLYGAYFLFTKIFF